MYPNGNIVEDFSMAAIEAAKITAGDGGTVLFPRGIYEVDGLTADFEDQTWIFQRGAMLRRSDSSPASIVTVPGGGSLEIVGGEFDGNRAGNMLTSGVFGIAANDGARLKMSGDFHVHGCPGVGIWGLNGQWDIRDGKVSDTGYWGVYWAATTLLAGQRRVAPKVIGVEVDRSASPISSGMGGGININGGPAVAECREAEIRNNTVRLPACSSVALRNAAYDSVGIEVNYSYMPIMTGNRIIGGRIGVSTQTCPWAIQSFNQGTAIGDYMIEMVNCEFGSACGNMATGAGLTIAHYGIEISGALTKGLNVVGNNTKMLFGISVHVASDAQGNGYPHTFAGNS